MTEQLDTGDEVVRASGWAFSRDRNEHESLESFVASGNDEVERLLDAFEVDRDRLSERTLVEIGSGIGRMTSALTELYGLVIACDLDAGFLHRCHETVGRFGRVDRLRTSHVADGHTLELAPNVADTTLSYSTFRHCDLDDAIDLSLEAVRVTKPDGRVVLNFRLPARADRILLPLAAAARMLYRVPALGRWLATKRPYMRIACEVSRCHPDQITGQLRPYLTDIRVFVAPDATVNSVDGSVHRADGIADGDWWLVAKVL